LEFSCGRLLFGFSPFISWEVAAVVVSEDDCCSVFNVSSIIFKSAVFSPIAKENLT